MGHPGPAVNHNALIEQRNPHVDAESQAELDQRSSPVVSPQANRRGRMADEGYETLLHQLMAKRSVPDSRVTIDALARELGVSQTPIRDALNRMEADGLVVRVPHSGYRIPPQLTRERFEDMVELRLLLEPAAARHAAERATAEQVADLRRMLDDMADLVRGDGHLAYGTFGLRDAAFHDLVAECAGNQLIREALARLHTHVHLFRLVFDTQVTYRAMSEHEEVLTAVAARDPDAASYAMRQHILLSRDRFRRLFDEGVGVSTPDERP